MPTPSHEEGRKWRGDISRRALADIMATGAAIPDREVAPPCG